MTSEEIVNHDWKVGETVYFLGWDNINWRNSEDKALKLINKDIKAARETIIYERQVTQIVDEVENGEVWHVIHINCNEDTCVYCIKDSASIFIKNGKLESCYDTYHKGLITVSTNRKDVEEAAEIVRAEYKKYLTETLKNKYLAKAAACDEYFAHIEEHFN